jgi:hypothetical protein
MSDASLAELYQVPTRTLNQAMRRNSDRFPADFMFQLTKQDATVLGSQFVILERGRGRYSKYAPFAFTEHGVAMLSSVLKSQREMRSIRKTLKRLVQTSQILQRKSATD